LFVTLEIEQAKLMMDAEREENEGATFAPQLVTKKVRKDN